MFALQAHGPDTFVGTGPRYPWGGLYGGQIVAQALRAAAESVDDAYVPHSIRAYFIRGGDHDEPVRYEVDRIRNGRSFVTRRVVARQAIGAILNAECSFQKAEQSVSVQTIACPDVPGPDTVENTSFSSHFERRSIEVPLTVADGRSGVGRVMAWMRAVDTLPPESVTGDQVLHQCWLAYISDDLATDSVRAAHQTASSGDEQQLSGVSLDHTVWFHRPLQANAWHLHDFTCHHYFGSRGLTIGHVFTTDGEHVATVAQEVLVREPRS